MAKLWLVAANEYRVHTRKRSFLFSLLSLPLLAAIVVGVGLLLDRSAPSAVTAVGVVDQAGLLTSIEPPGTDSDFHFLPLPSEEEARSALARGEIDAYYVLPADYRANRRVLLYAEQDPPGEVIGAFRELLQANLLAGQPDEVARRAAAGSEQVVRLPDGREFGGEFNLGSILPVLASLVLVVMIFFGSGYLVQALTDEKANRTMEILASSLSAGRLIAGKVLGIVAVSLTQLLVWAALGAGVVWFGHSSLGWTWVADLQVDPALMLLVGVLVLLAYLLVASLMTAIGVTLDDPRAGQQVMGVFISLYMLPIGFIGPVLNDLNGGLSTALSLIPITSPVFLPLRASFVDLPAWQILVGVGLAFLCALGGLWLAGRAVRLGMLHYGRPLRLALRLGRRARSVETGRRRERDWGPDRGTGPQSATGQRRGKAFLITRQELIHVLTRPWFVLMLVGLPLLIVLQMLLIGGVVEGDQAGPPTQVDATVAMPSEEARLAFGYVDRAGLVQTLPQPVPPGMVRAYPDEAAAARALERGEISSYFLLPVDYLESGELIQVRADFSPMMPSTAARWMDWVILVNLLEGDLSLAAQVWNPIDLQVLEPEASPSGGLPTEASAEDEEAEDQERLTSMLILLLFYAVIVMAAGFLLRSVSEEKKSRTIEVLLLSASPRQILLGKTVALGLAGLIQAVGWGVIGYALFSWGGMTFRLPATLELSPGVLVWIAVYFLLGYGVYAAMFAGAGALVPNWREASGVSLLLILPALVGFEISLFLADSPHSPLMVGASIFPLTAPFTMIKRLLSGGVPLWQLFLAAGLMAITAYWITGAVARLFHAQNLLSGQPFSVPRYVRALLGQGGASSG